MASTKRQPRPNLIRARLGQSQAKVAGALQMLAADLHVRRDIKVGPGHLHRWETGRNDPAPVYVYLLCRHYDKAPEEIDLANCWDWEVDPRYARLSLVDDKHPDHQVEERVERRKFTKGVAGAFLGIPILLDWERADATLQRDYRPDRKLFDQLQPLVSVLTSTTTRQLDSGSPELPAPMLRGALTFTQSLLRGHDHPPELAMAISQLGLLYGWLSFQLDNKSEARGTYRLAARAARDAGHAPLEATVLAAASQLDSAIPYGGYQSSGRSLVILDRANALIERATNVPVVQAWILARRAQERAALGDAIGAQDDLLVARDQFQPSAVTSDMFYAYPNQGWIDGYEASCHRLLHRWQDAEAAYTRVLSAPSSPLWRSVTMSSLASVQARQGSPDQAAHTLQMAIELAIQTNTPLRIRHIYGARAQLDQFPTTPAVKALDELLSQVIQV